MLLATDSRILHSAFGLLSFEIPWAEAPSVISITPQCKRPSAPPVQRRMKQRWLALVLVAPAILMADAKPPAVCLRSLPLISVHALSVTADAVATKIGR